MSAVDSPAGGPDVEDVPGAAPFGVSLAEAMDAHGPLCVGIDPHRTLLESWGLPDTPQGLREFALRTVDALGGRVAAVKPQSAFFERHGGAGVTVLEEVLAALRDIGTMSILDVKRGDIGSTMGGYAQAYLLDEAPLAADAITVSPYLGYGSLKPALDLADAADKLVADYSAGMTKKISLASALIHAPRLLILDEPLEAVDPVSGQVIRDLLRDYVDGGGTVLLSSHVMELVESICDGVGIMAAGRILVSGTVDQVRGDASLQQKFVELVGQGRMAGEETLQWLRHSSL